MRDYSKTIIYKIECKDVNIKDVYIGQTTNFINRKAVHKIRCNHNNNPKYYYKIYECMRNNGGFNNWDIIKLENYNCNNLKEAINREKYYMNLLNPTLNKRR